MAAINVELQTDSLKLSWNDGRNAEFNFVWLRDNQPEHRHKNGQKLVDSLSIPLNSKPLGVVCNDGILTINWADDKSKSNYDTEWLWQHSFEYLQKLFCLQATNILPWNNEIISNKIKRYSYPKLLKKEKYLLEMLEDVVTKGFAVLSKVACKKKMVLKVVELFGYVRKTNYGSLFDVIVTPNPTNLAFTSLSLPGHTDNPYRHPAPTLQLLHYLKNDVAGGENTLVDGIYVAECLRKQNPTAFKLLAETAVCFKFQSQDTWLEYQGYIIETDKQDNVLGVRFNSRSIQPFAMPAYKIGEFYKAYHQFGNILADQKNIVKLKLENGELLLFSNQRILHGRVGYESSKGKRHLQGCYADVDSLNSKYKILRLKHGK